MGKIFTRFVLAALALFLPDSPVLAQSASLCDSFVKYAVANAQRVRDLGGCGLNTNDVSLSTDTKAQWNWCWPLRDETKLQRMKELAAQTAVCERCTGFANYAVENAKRVRQIDGGCGLNLDDPSLSLNPNPHLSFCSFVLPETVALRQRELQAQTEKCQYCSDYSNTMASYANYNQVNRCGYSPAGGDNRWVTGKQFHLFGCMATEAACNNRETTYFLGFIPMESFGEAGCERTSPPTQLNAIIKDVGQRLEGCSPIGTAQQPLTSVHSSWASAIERMRRRRMEERAAQARERMLMGGGSSSEVVESYSEAKAKARERELIGGSRSEMVGTYTSQKEIPSGGAGGSETPPAVVPSAGGTADGPRAGSAPASGGAGGSLGTVWGAQPAYEWKLGPDPTAVPSGGAGGSEAAWVQPQPPAIPDSGGAGGSETALQAPQQVCLNDPKSFGDAQLRLLLADPKIHARLTSLIAEEPTARKAKTAPQKRRGKRVRAPTDADIARSNSGISPEAANAIGTIIGVGIGVGLNNAGRRGASGAAPHRGASGAAPRRGTFDGPPR
jgi:hypothetical protein